jgi:hypothetical protein
MKPQRILTKSDDEIDPSESKYYRSFGGRLMYAGTVQDPVYVSHLCLSLSLAILTKLNQNPDKFPSYGSKGKQHVGHQSSTTPF